MSARRFTEGYCRYALKGVIALPSDIFRPGKVVPNILFSVVVVCFSWSLFSVLCYVFLSLSLSLSGSLSLSCRQCCRLKFLSSWLLMLKVGIQWEMRRRKNTASFITLVCFYVSLVKINSRKLETRASCSLAKHVHPVEGNSGFPFRVYSESVIYLIAGGKPVCFLLKCQYVPVLYVAFKHCNMQADVKRF